MSLHFAGSGGSNRVNVGSASNLDNVNPCTIIAWVWFNAFGTNSDCVYGKGITSLRTNLYVASATALTVVRGRTTTSTQAQANTSAFASIATGKWCLFCGQYSTGGAASAQKLYGGDLVTPAAEPSSYTTQTAGSGTASSNAANSGIVGNNTNFTQEFNGEIAVVALYGALLTAAQIQSWQFNPRARVDSTLALGMWHLGRNPAGTGTQPDISGNGNNGTVTGATASAHVPLWEFLAQRRRRERHIAAIGRRILRKVA